MAESRRLRQLKSRIAEIDRHFMPAIRVTGNYSRSERDKMRALRLLTHAEIESYLEDSAIGRMDKAYDRYKKSRKASGPIISMLTYCDISSQSTPKSSAQNHDNCFARVSKIFTHFKNKAKHHNHGIKEENILSLLMPAGIELADIDATLINTLNSYGTARGGVAHNSAKTQQPIDPATEKATIMLIIQELEKLDIKLRR